MTETGPVLGRLEEPTTEQPTRLALLSDLHLAVEMEGSWRVSHRTESRLEAAVDSLNRRELDGVVFVGDLVQSGTRAQYQAFDRLVDGLDHPFFAVPGNHDLVEFGSGEKLALSAFERRYTPGRLPYHERIGGVDLLALNSNASTRDSVAETYTGRLSPDSLAWLEGKLETVDVPLVAVHHNLSGTRSLLFDWGERLPVEPGSPPFENDGELLDVLERTGSPLVVTGHVHFPAIVRTRGVREFTLPSLGPYPGAYTVLEVDERGTTATLQPILDREERLEALVSGLEHSRVLIAAAQLAGLPLVDEFAADPRP
ncbi:metallophosphoesterase family protein [Natrononativus amylolyticus]|uniref:metallophosphoesterase family protein n=1 Tax=Natrononativus amylolyticus TaxID=2963434 RepID=UPI0020CC0DC9|nr:metallophosphoesterase [Natrononativus amylolyticus]